MGLYLALFAAAVIGFVLEEFVLIRPVSTIAQSDPVSRRLERAAILVPAVGMGLTGATMGSLGGVRGSGILNLAGFVLCLAGLGLRYWARRTLGRFFTIGVVRQEGHTVVETGPYGRVRHPAYLGFVLYYLGFPIIVGSWGGLLLLSLPSLVVFLMLVRIEDSRLADALGPEYRAYQSRTHRLIPGVW